MQKARGCAYVYIASTACRYLVSVSISLPFRGSFHLSLTVLVHYGHQVVFSLTPWSGQIPTEFHVLHGTWENNCHKHPQFYLQDFHLLWLPFPEHLIIVAVTALGQHT